MNSKKLYGILKSKGITHLYHANTLITSCHFLFKGALLSRKKVEKLNLNQTDQKSDDLDKNFGIYNDIFLDSCDIHKRASHRNLYGPVLLKINIEILKYEKNESIWITKENPQNWSKFNNDKSRWFKNLIEVKSEFGEYDFKQILVFRKSNGKLKLNGFLDEVIIDNPERIYLSKDCLSYAMGALRYAYTLGPLFSVKFKIRKCRSSCNCKKEYENFTKEKLKKHFSPMAY